MLYPFNELRLVEIILMFETLEVGGSLQMLCPFCNPCDSFKFLPINLDLSSISLTIISKHVDAMPGLYNVYVLLAVDLFRYNLKTVGRIDLLKVVGKMRINQYIGFARYFADMHILAMIFDKSTNTTFSYEFPPFHEESENELRFVSCHKEQAHWANQLQELICAFDMGSWSLIFISCFVLTYLVVLIRKVCTFTKNKTLEFWSVYFALLASMLDQSDSLFARTQSRRKCSYYCLLFFVPIIGILTRSSARFRYSPEIPSSSEPIMIAAGVVKSQSK